MLGAESAPAQRGKSTFRDKQSSSLSALLGERQTKPRNEDVPEVARILKTSERTHIRRKNSRKSATPNKTVRKRGLEACRKPRSVTNRTPKRISYDSIRKRDQTARRHLARTPRQQDNVPNNNPMTSNLPKVRSVTPRTQNRIL